MITADWSQERGKGIPLNDTQRVARHYGISIQEACDLLAVYSPTELLPERGYGLTAGGQMIGYTVDDLRLSLDTMEASLPKGAQLKLALYTENLPTDEALADLFLNATAAGFHMDYPQARVESDVTVTELILTKGSPVLPALIPLILPVLIIGLIFFVVTKIETVAKALLPILILGVTGIIVLAGIARSERLGTKYIERRFSPKTEKKVLAAR